MPSAADLSNDDFAIYMRRKRAPVVEGPAPDLFEDLRTAKERQKQNDDSRRAVAQIQRLKREEKRKAIIETVEVARDLELDSFAVEVGASRVRGETDDTFRRRVIAALKRR